MERMLAGSTGPKSRSTLDAAPQPIAGARKTGLKRLPAAFYAAMGVNLILWVLIAIIAETLI